MNRRIAFPFLTLAGKAITDEPWSFSLNGENVQPAGGFLRDWDAASKIRMRRTIRVDSKIAARHLGIAPASLYLALGIRVGTGPGRLPRRILHREWRPLAHGEWREEIDVKVSGDQLSLVLDVQTQVLLARPPDDCGPLSPRRVGSRLWYDSLRVLLEGEDPRFPMEVADFRTLLGGGTAAAAPWFLHWSPRDWNRDFQGAVRLYLNKDTASFTEKIKEEDGPTLQVLLADVMGQICERLVSDPQAVEIMAETEPGSLAAQATGWLRTIWPDKDAAFVRSVLEQQPGRFRAAFLELADLGEV